MFVTIRTIYTDKIYFIKKKTFFSHFVSKKSKETIF